MARFRNPASGHVVIMPDDASDQQVQMRINAESEAFTSREKEVSAARAKARSMDPMGDPTLGAVTPAGQQAAAEKAEAFGANQGMDALEEFMGSQGLQDAPGQAILAKGAEGGGMAPSGPPTAPTGPTEGQDVPGFLEFLGRSAAGPLVGPSGSEPGAPLEFLGSAYNPEDVSRQRRGFIRHAPSILAGAAAGGLTGGIPSLLARIGIQSGAMGAGEAVGAAGVGEDPTEAGLMGLLFGAGGEALGTSVGKVAAPFAKSVTGAGKRLIEKVRPRGGVVTPGQASSNAALDFAENLAEGIGGKRVMRQAKGKTEEIVDDLLWEFRKDYPGNDKKALTALYDKAFNAPSTAGRLGDEIVNLRPAYRAAQTLLARNPDQAGIKQLVGIFDDYMPKGKLATFETAHRLASSLKEWTRAHVAVSPLKTGTALGAGKTLVKGVMEDMEAVARKTGGNAAVDLWKAADRTRKLVSEGEWIEKTLKLSRGAKGRYTEPGKDIINGKTLSNRLAKYDPDDMPLDPAAFKAFKEFAEALATAQFRDPEGTGRIFVQLMQAGAIGGAVGGLATGKWEGAAGGAGAGILVGPAILSRILTNPKMAKYLTTGLGGPTTAARARAIATLTAELGGHAAYTAPWDVAP